MIYYIYHSGFLVELEKAILVFDFYRFPEGKKEAGKEFIEKILKKDKKIFVFSSHSHHDHFNKEILEWQKINNQITYILSDDIKITSQYKNIIFTREGDKLNLEKDKIKINVFGSTDLGVSFYVNVEGKNIFHAGDLHFWHWEDDSESEKTAMKSAYVSILKEVQKLDRIDIAFSPVDPRLEKNVFDGIEIFYSILKPRIIVPIHFADDYSEMKNLKERFKDEEVNIVEIYDTLKKVMEL